jgi:5'-nucleotidase
VPVKTHGRTIRVGVLGLTIDSNRQPWVRYQPPIESARAAIAQLRNKCDVIVALTHVTLQTDIQIAEQVSDIELILGGHDHENYVIERGAYFTPILKADANARTVIVATLRIPANGGRPESSARIERIDDRIKDEPRTAREVARWTDLGFAGFRKDGFEPSDIVKVVDRPMRGTEAEVRAGSTQLTELIADAMRHEAGTEMSVFNAGSIRIDDVLIPGPVTQYDIIRVLPFGGKVLKATLTGDLLSRVLEIGRRNKGTGGFLQTAGIPATIDPAGRYTLAISDFLLTGAEINLGFLTRQNLEVSDVTELRDVRLAVIDELRRR